MSNVSGIIKSIQDIMRKDVGVDGDAQRIIDAGWGELHPLAGRPPIGLPEPYVLLYSPRDRYDVEQITRILDRVVETALRTG